MQPDQRFKIAGYVAWLAIAAPTFVDVRGGRLDGWRAILWTAGFLAFGTMYALYLRPDASAGRRHAPAALIAGLAASGLTMVLTSVSLMKYLAGVTLTIVAGELPHVFAPAIAWTWIAAQSAVLAAVFWASFGWVAALSGGSAYAGFQAFAMGKAWLERSERAAREELTRANAELQATRARLAESSRVAERLRIARDLHDSLGHHLTALTIQLDVASRRVDGPAADDIREAYAITRLLLGDVRHVVGQLREHGRIDLAEAVRTLTSQTDGPRIRVEMPDTLYLDDPAQANAWIRCVQEIVTNATKHARAGNVWIRLTPSAGGIDLHARDDGAGTASLTLGHGLTGMRERFEEHAGTIAFRTAPGHGFEVRAFMPRPESAS